MIVHFVPDGKATGMTGGKQGGGHKVRETTNNKKEIVPAGKDGELSKK